MQSFWPQRFKSRLTSNMALQPAWLRGIPFDLWYGLAINLVSPGGPRRLAMRLNAKSLYGGECGSGQNLLH